MAVGMKAMLAGSLWFQRASNAALPICSATALSLALLGQSAAAADGEAEMAAGSAAQRSMTQSGTPPSTNAALVTDIQAAHALELRLPPLMLAEVWRSGLPVADYWVSEKLDGVRAWWDGERLVSRGGHVILAPDWFTAGLPAEPLDGELWLGRGRFEDLSGTVRRRVPDDGAWREVRYRVFDLPAEPGPFGARLVRLRERVTAAGNLRLEAVEQVRLTDAAALETMLARVVAAGGEGLMLHRDGAPYRPGRSPDLLKLKPYEDAEARVVALIPGQGRFRGLMGALEVEDGEGRRFRIGTGFTLAVRRDPPPPGTLVTYQYRGRTEAGLPRFASFLRAVPEPP
jgi:DNA ligase 1